MMLTRELTSRMLVLQDAEATVKLTGKNVLVVTDRTALCGASFGPKGLFDETMRTVGVSYEDVTSLVGSRKKSDSFIRYLGY